MAKTLPQKIKITEKKTGKQMTFSKVKPQPPRQLNTKFTMKPTTNV